jgi:hypothetical protein
MVQASQAGPAPATICPVAAVTAGGLHGPASAENEGLRRARVGPRPAAALGLRRGPGDRDRGARRRPTAAWRSWTTAAGQAVVRALPGRSGPGQTARVPMVLKIWRATSGSGSASDTPPIGTQTSRPVAAPGRPMAANGSCAEADLAARRTRLHICGAPIVTLVRHPLFRGPWLSMRPRCALIKRVMIGRGPGVQSVDACYNLGLGSWP